MNEVIFVIIAFCFASVLVAGQQNIGDACVARYSRPGICKTINRCTSVRADLMNGNQNYVECSHRGMTLIVCCPMTERNSTNKTRITATPPPSSLRISAQKCNYYRTFALRTYYTINSIQAQETMSNCASIPLVAGGTVANVREFPHMALIGFQLPDSVQWLCGGSLISERFVLTAAHCTKYKDSGVSYDATHVRLGEHDRNHDDDGREMEILIEEMIRHHDYKASRYYYDIALLKLDRTIQLSRAIRPACLYQSSGDPQGKVIATGWGSIGHREYVNDVLMKVTLNAFSHANCNSTLQPYFGRRLRQGILEESQICAGFHTRPRDTCQGDSGGPLQTYHATHECTYDVVGVTSFDLSCSHVGMPAVFTRVSAFLDWIEAIVWADQ